jgi:muramoyltetrapeptide carboxypeptidase
MVAGSFGRYAMKKTRGQFSDLLTGQPGATRLQWPGARALCEGRAQGPLTGGCLTLLCRSLGTPYEVDTRGKILVIEDVNEPPYKVDGMLWQLRAAGKFKDVKGVIVGEMVGCGKGPAAKRWLDESFREVFSEGGFPVVTNFPLGHGREMWTLPLGVDATLDAENLTLSLASCGVV